MWSAILGIIDKILGIFKDKRAVAASREKISNEAPFREAKIKEEKVKKIDEYEDIVSKIDGSNSVGDTKAMEEIRKKLGK